MKIYNHFRITLALWAFCFLSTVGILSSCSGSEYINAIPSESQMLIRLNPAKLSGTKSPLILKTLLHLKDLDESGIDLSKDVFFLRMGKATSDFAPKLAVTASLKNRCRRQACRLPNAVTISLPLYHQVG